MKESIIFGVHKLEDIETTGSVNPMVNLYGRGPFRTCKGCIHLIDSTTPRTSVECRLRSELGQMRPKHSSFWPACGKYEPRP